MNRRAVSACLALASIGCSLEAFAPRVEGEDASVSSSDASSADAGRDAALRDTGADAIEDCFNRMDDDGDGQIDCADEACSASRCAAPPVGWTGPVAVVPATAECPAGYSTIRETLGVSGLMADEASCRCECDAPADPGCVGTFRTYQNGVCFPGFDEREVSNGGCLRLTDTRSIDTAVVTFSATCGDGTAVLDGPAPTFAASIRVCEPPGGLDCGGTDCAPPLEGATECVFQEGLHACPDAYPTQRLAYRGLDDHRSCGACTCRPEGTCAGGIELYSDVGCNIAVGTLTGVGCEDFGDMDSAALAATASGTCVGTPGAASGCVEPGMPVTVCCGAGPGCPGRAGPAMARIAPSDGGTPYCIDTTEVTSADYQAFLAAGGPNGTRAECAGNETALVGTPPPVTQPITNVDWCDAAAFCEWAGKRLCGLRSGEPGRGDNDDESDPALSEWRHACSELDRTADQYGASCPYSSTTRRDVRADACCQREGVHQLAGNANEWIDSCRDDRCLVHAQDSCNQATLIDRDTPQPSVGFRCCADAS